MQFVLMREDIRLAKITTKPWLENANFKLYHELIPREDEKNTHVKTTPRQQRFEKMSCK